MAIENYYEVSKPVAKTISIYFKVLLPDTYKKFKAAFKAGKWVRGDPGPWLGRAIIFKLQSSLHVDDKDEGPTVSFPSGHFEGGKMIVPETPVKLSYVSF